MTQKSFHTLLGQTTGPDKELSCQGWGIVLGRPLILLYLFLGGGIKLIVPALGPAHEKANMGTLTMHKGLWYAVWNKGTGMNSGNSELRLC